MWWRQHCNFQVSNYYVETTPNIVQQIEELNDMLFFHNNLQYTVHINECHYKNNGDIMTLIKIL